MALIRDGKIVEDAWRHAEDAEALDHDGPLFAGLAHWRQHFGQLKSRNRPTGLRLESDEAPEDVEDLLAYVDAIALSFPKFTDGRAYSHARILRERYGFDREIRACGEILPDQVLLMTRCGFDTFELPEDAKAETYLRAFQAFGVFYQPATDNRPFAARLRRRQEEKAS
ncbi:MAG: DUF934 domain-containing protein [Rhodovibrionaceae bacterium]|nr:DUF934 domain-containing protein [Rhodovibrionaceae bacterium]